MCKVSPNARGTHTSHAKRETQETLAILKSRDRDDSDAQTKEEFKELGLRPVYPPFWATLPHADVFEWFTPDLLHQLHKGVFKDHLVKWCTAIISEDELDARFRAMSEVTGLRHFSHGISTVSQWTGSEHKEMEKIFLGLIAGAADARVIKAVRAVIDFIHLASLHSHTTQTLAALEQALENFHAHKAVFIELGARNQDHFNIPKIHAMEHYAAMILRFGSADGFNTESPERLHIDYAKDAYRASNRKDYLAQMVVWLRRQEAIDRFSLYLNWCQHGAHRSEDTSTDLEPLESELEDAECVVVVEQSLGVSESPASGGYKVAAKHARGLRGIPIAHIMDSHRAPRLMEALNLFLNKRGCSFKPQPFDGLNLFSRLSVYLPPIPATGYQHLKNIIRATPPVASRPRRAAVPAQLDFALLRTGETNAVTAGTPLEGARDGVVEHRRLILM